MIRDQTVAGRCVVVEDTLLSRSRCVIVANANTTGAATSSARPAPRSCWWTAAADRLSLENWTVGQKNILEDFSHACCCYVRCIVL